MKTTEILLAGLVLFLSACEGPAFFSSSLSEPGEVSIDESIVGVWYVRSSSDEILLLNIARIGENRLGVVVSTMGADAKSEKGFRTENSSFYLIAHPSELNGEHYYNVAILDAASLKEFMDPEKSEKFAGFMIHKATIIDDEWLVVYTVMEDSPEELVGWSEANSRRMRNAAKYNVSRDDLRGLLSTAEPEDLFKPFLFFRRLQVLKEEFLPPEIRNESRWRL